MVLSRKIAQLLKDVPRIVCLTDKSGMSETLTSLEEGLTRVYRYQIKPTSKQITLLNAALADHCSMYNAALEERKLAWKHSTKTSVRYEDQSKQLKEIRRADPLGLGRWSFSSQQQTLRRLHIAYASFYRRVLAGQTPGFPRFKSVKTFNTVTFINGDGGKFNEAERQVYMLGVGHVKVNLHRATKGIVKQFSITREGRHWFVNVTCVKIPKELRAPTGSAIGLDMGITNLLADSNGNLWRNPRPTKTNAARLARAQQAVSRCKKGSSREAKKRALVASIHRSTRNQRYDNNHKISHKLVKENDFIFFEILRILKMASKGSKKKLGKEIHDAAWATITRMTTYKAVNAGVTVMLVPPEYTSQMCFECKYIDPRNRNGDKFLCLSCGHEDHADTNAAKNICWLGLSLRESCLTAA